MKMERKLFIGYHKTKQSALAFAKKYSKNRKWVYGIKHGKVPTSQAILIPRKYALGWAIIAKRKKKKRRK